jgi:polyphosphate kinase 2
MQRAARPMLHTMMVRSAGSMSRDKARHEKASHEKVLRRLQIELVKCQRHLIEEGRRVLVIVEGRDAAGKDGTIKHLVEHMSPRETHVVALGKPSELERASWYFQRWVPHLPAAEQFVVLNRSWYNRAGVERVMGFCTEAETAAFLDHVPSFEKLLVEDGIRLFKYYLDISRKEQARRLGDRARDPLKQWKISPIDKAAQKRWAQYSRARDAMLLATHTPQAPWVVVRADDKPQARVNLIRDLLWRLGYPGRKVTRKDAADPSVAFEFEARFLKDGSIAK